MYSRSAAAHFDCAALTSKVDLKIRERSSLKVAVCLTISPTTPLPPRCVLSLPPSPSPRDLLEPLMGRSLHLTSPCG